MKNVLSIVTYKILPAKLGGQKGIALFNEYFSRHVNLFCFTVAANDPSLAGYPVFNHLPDASSRYYNVFYFFRLKKIIRANKITHVICEHPYYGWMALLLKRFCKVRVIIHSHNIESERFKTVGKWWWKLLWHYERFIHHHADFTFCISQQDRNYFFEKYGIPYEKTAVITYGISWKEPTSFIERAAAKNALIARYELLPQTFIFLFNGTLDYGPNLDAVKNIVDRINPVFIEKKICYKIFICGKGLPPELNELKDFADKNIIYTGFVDDISIYFKGADVFINPVNSGGGIKTKLVESLGYNLNAVSTENGAIGVDVNICGGKLFICEKDNWRGFASQMEAATAVMQTTPAVFFDHFYWENIAATAANILPPGTHS